MGNILPDDIAFVDHERPLACRTVGQSRHKRQTSICGQPGHEAGRLAFVIPKPLEKLIFPVTRQVEFEMRLMTVGCCLDADVMPVFAQATRRRQAGWPVMLRGLSAGADTQ